MTYVFPQDTDEFEADRLSPQVAQDNTLWIFKPSASSCGKGIRILDKDTPIPANKKGFVISEYISNPHIIDSKKYDLRIYVLVTNFDPLTIYIYEDGLVRFATQDYNLEPDDFDNKFVHLTNYSIQKKCDEYIQNKQKEENSINSSKWSLKTLEKVFQHTKKDFKKVQDGMNDLIIKTLISVEPPIVDGYDKCTTIPGVCFELYGFDIMLDSDLKPWLLEVNISPSFSSSSPFDKSIKTRLACDSFTLSGVKLIDHELAEAAE